MEKHAAKLLTYLAEGLAPVRPIRIADVGANPTEAPPYQALAKAGLAEIWGFEPNDAARVKLAANQPDWLHVLPQAVGRPGKARFHAYPASEMSSIFPLSQSAIGYLGHFRRHLGKDTVTDVELVGLDQLPELPALDLLKTDAQGAEVQILQSGRDKLSNAVAVITEIRFYQLYDGEPELHEMDAELRSHGFVLHKLIKPKTRMLHNSQMARLNRHEIGSQLIDGDAVYIRKFEDRSAWSDDQLKHLALLAATVFHSHDLALMALDELANRGNMNLAPGYVDFLPDHLRA